MLPEPPIVGARRMTGRVRQTFTFELMPRRNICLMDGRCSQLKKN